jgi:hypothetical protein
MSPTSTAPSTPSIEPFGPFTPHVPSLTIPHGMGQSIHGPSTPRVAHPDFDSPTSPHPSGRHDGSSISDMLSDGLFSHATDPSTFSSPLLSGSPDGVLSDLDAERLAKEDPLATQVREMVRPPRMLTFLTRSAYRI